MNANEVTCISETVSRMSKTSRISHPFFIRTPSPSPCLKPGNQESKLKWAKLSAPQIRTLAHQMQSVLSFCETQMFLYNSFEVSIISGGRNTDFSFFNFTRGQRSQAFLLYVRSQLIDFEPGENNYSLTLQSRDTHRPELTATAVVRVEVSDVNDNSPVFLNSS
ncbi:hypothetical protein DPMN_142227 [Dreissena polymorpha]|uniref:Cadherin domain-containing protein n=1 Tax=Dreissena polymorpha TaxID=45954 RepID=A0A9D4GAW1_DREPO|nr:hypothetical protein DPMN_142227 [Dreissena polymorpha]